MPYENSALMLPGWHDFLARLGRTLAGRRRQRDPISGRCSGSRSSLPVGGWVWRVLENRLNFIEDRNEWDGTEISFEITAKGNQTEVRFTHHGLVPKVECCNDCSSAWGGCINGSLRRLIETGKAQDDAPPAAMAGSSTGRG